MADADWSVLELEGVDDIIRRAAGMVVSQYGDPFDVDDLHQDGRILAVTNAQTVRDYIDGGNEGFLNNWLVQRLTNSVQKEVRHRDLTIGIHRLYGDE